MAAASPTMSSLAEAGDYSSTMQRSVLHDSNTNSTDVKVVVRVRPQTLDMELQPGVQTCVDVEGHNVCTVRSPHESVSMAFNWVAGPATTQNEFFKVVGRPTVENCLSGFNSSIFAYGQTGSGKTYTMIGELPDDGTASLPTNAGIIPRIFKYLWQRMPEVQAGLLANPGSSNGSMRSSTSSLAFGELRRSLAGDEAGGSRASDQPSLKWLVRCSMLEIHKEDIYDLLRPGNGPLNIREDIRKGVYVEGLCEKVAEDVSDALDVLRAGIANRQVAATEMNAASSRSHCIFTCHIESRLEPQAGMINVRSSRLHLVDLAGSERLKASWASALASSSANSVSSSWDGGGMSGGGSGSNLRLRETTSINSSLTVLGLVILRLTEQQPHIPYRNSKLTFLLQDSIGGNAKTVIVANVSPSEACLQETLSTLGFAARARKIVNKAVVNEDHNDDIALLRQKVKRLQQELSLARTLAAKASAGLRVSDTGNLAASAAAQQAADAATQQLLEQQEQLAGALQLLRELGDRNSELEQAVEFWQRERDALEQSCLDARQELAAMQVSLQQAMSENKSWRHRWFKPDKAGKSSQAQQDKVVSAADSAAEPGRATTKALQSQGSAGWSFSSMFGKKDKARAAAAEAVAVAGPGVSENHEGTSQAFQETPTEQHAWQAGHQVQQQRELDIRQEQQQHLHRVLQLVSSQLQQVAAHVCGTARQQAQPAPSSAYTGGGQGSLVPPAAPAAAVPATPPQHGEAVAADAGTGCQLQSAGLLQLQELQQQHQDDMPELQGILDVLTSLAAWRKQEQQQEQQQLQQQHQPQQDLEAPPSSPCKASSSKMAPSELHRQLIEERQQTSQLQAHIRQLQQELLLAGGPAVATTVPLPASASATPMSTKVTSAAARMARLSPGVGLHYSADAACTKGLHVAPTELDAAFAQVAEQPTAEAHKAAGDAEAADPPCQPPALEPGAAAEVAQAPVSEPVVVEVRIVANDSKSAQSQARPEAAAAGAQQQEQALLQASEAAAAAAEEQQLIAALRAEVSELREQLDAVHRERANMHSRLQSARTVLAAARCSTPSSLLSSTLPSPQPSFGLLQPVFADSIIEEPEGEEYDEEDGDEPSCPPDVVLVGSVSSWQPEPEPVSPCASPSRSSSSQGTGGSQQGLDEDLSQAEVWQQHHAEVQQYQQQYEHVEQLTKAVHAALNAAECMKYKPWSPAAPQHQQLPSTSTTQAAAPVDQRQQQWWHQAAAGEADNRDASRSETTRSDGSTRGSSFSQLNSGSAVISPEPCLEHVVTHANPLADGMASPDPVLGVVHGAAGSHPVVTLSGGLPGGAAMAAQPSSTTQQQAVQTDEEWPSGPAWGVAEYEEELRQLSEQLQGLVSQNSSLKALLQQRDAELAAQQERLEQQGHDLACCEEMLQELQERLAASEAAAAASAAEHCNAMWAQGQVAGLMELNEVLQGQLEAQGAELQDRTQQLELRAREVQELQEALHRYSSHSSQSSPQPGNDADAPLETATQPADIAPAAGDISATGGVSPKCAAAKPSLAGTPTSGGAADAVSHESWTDQQCKTPNSAAGTPNVQGPLGRCTSGSKRRRQLQGHRHGTPGRTEPAVLGVDQAVHMSPFKQLRMQTHQLRAEPHNTQVATEQAALLQHQLAAVGLHLQRAQLEKQLADVKAQLQQIKHKQQQQQQQGPGSLLGCSPDSVPADWSPAQTDWEYLTHRHQQQSPTRLSLLSRLPHLVADSNAGEQHLADLAEDAAPTAPLEAAAGRAADGVAGSSIHLQQLPPCAAAAEDAEGQGCAGNNSTGSSAASTPRSSSSSGVSCLEELEAIEQDLHSLAAASHQASAFKAVSASTLSPLRRQQQQQQQALRLSTSGTAALAAAADPCSMCLSCASSPGGLAQPFAVVVAAGSSPAAGPDTAAGGPADLKPAVWTPDAALKLQSDLQVSSAYELAAARGLLHAGAVLQELKSTLASEQTARSRHRKQRGTPAATAAEGAVTAAAASPAQTAASTPASSKHGGVVQQGQHGQLSPPVARALFGSFDGNSCGNLGADLAVAGAANPQQAGFSILRQLQQQQQYIIQVLGSLAATQHQQQDEVLGGSPVANQLQHLAEAQQQLQVVLHAASMAIQQAHALPPGSSSTATHEQPSLLGHGQDQEAAAGPPQQGQGSQRADAAPALISSSSPSRPHRKSQQQQLLLQGGSPDQQQQRDSSPDKLRRSYGAWSPPPAAPTVRQQDDAAAGSSPSITEPAVCHSQGPGQQGSSASGLCRAVVPQQSQQEVDRQVQELTRLRGYVIRLQLEMQELRQRAQAAESLLIGTGRRSTTPDQGWARQSQDSVSTPAAATSGGCTGGSTAVTADSCSSAGTPTQLVLLSGKNRELQVQCLQRDNQIKHLEAELRRLQVELKQQTLAAAVPALTLGASGPGTLTPRNAIGGLTPRHGLAGIASSGPSIFSPQRRAASSPGTTTGVPRTFSPAAAFAGLSGAAGAQVQQQPQMSASRFGSATHSSSAGSGVEAQSWLQQYVVGTTASSGQQEPLMREQHAHSNVLVRASLDTNVSCASTSSNKSRGRGIRVGSGKPPLHVPSLRPHSKTDRGPGA